MQRIVTGSFEDFAGAARGVSALMADGFGHGDISIIALPPTEPASRPPDRLRQGALIAGAIGAMIGPGSVWAWAPDAVVALLWAPTLGAIAGAVLGAFLASLFRSVDRPAAEAVSVVVDHVRAGRVEAILREHGAMLDWRRPRVPVMRPVPYRP